MLGPTYDISVFNNLIAATIDSVAGYTHAVRDSESSYVYALFATRADERRKIVIRMLEKVTALGGQAENAGTVLAGMQRLFLNLRASVSRHDDKAIISEVETGEDHLRAAYEEALRDVRISPASVALIEECFASVQQGHDEMRNVHHSMGL